MRLLFKLNKKIKISVLLIALMIFVIAITLRATELNVNHDNTPKTKFYYDTYDIGNKFFENDKLLAKNLSDVAREQRLAYMKKLADNSHLPDNVMPLISNLKSSDIIQHDINMRKKISWDEFEKSFKNDNSNEFYLFGFGSLMNNCCNYNQSNNIASVLYGMKRVYAVQHPKPQTSPIGLPNLQHPKEELRLDTVLTNDINDITNGVLLKFEIGSPDYEHMKFRERSYSIVKIKVVDYKSLLNGEPKYITAYVLSANASLVDVDITLRPHVIYHELVLDGANDVEKRGNTGFLELFMQTTFLPDGKTPVKKWLDKASF